jgi:hypothetical protein
MKLFTKNIFFQILLPFAFIFLPQDNIDAQAQTNICNDNRPYSPIGQWKKLGIIKEAKNGWNRSLWIPDFIPDYRKILEGGKLTGNVYSNQLLLFNRYQTYEELFIELLLQTENNDVSVISKVFNPVLNSLGTTEKAYSVLKEANFGTSSSQVAAELGSWLKVITLILETAKNTTEADQKVLLMYGAFSALQTTRYKLIKKELNQLTNIDPELLKGLELAYKKIQNQKQKDLEEMRKTARLSVAGKTITKGFVKIAAESMFGNAIIGVLGKGVLSAGISVALPAAWIYQLARSINAERNEASLVLSSTIDRSIFCFISFNSLPISDQYIVEQMRTYLSFLSTKLAKNYKTNGSMPYQEKIAIIEWAEGNPHYDPNILKNLEESAKKELFLHCGINEQFLSRNKNTIPINGLVAYYPFNGNTNDESGNGNNGIAYGRLSYDSDRFGNPSKAASFNGTNSYIIVPNSNSLKLSNDLTVCAWVKCVSPQNEGGIVDKYYDQTYRWSGWLLATITDGKAMFEGRDNNTDALSRRSGPTCDFSDNHWHFIVGVRCGNDWKIYIDGILSSHNVYSSHGSIESGGDLRIGALRSKSTSNFWKGQIDDIFIYNRAITEKDIQDIYSLGNFAAIKTINNDIFQHKSKNISLSKKKSSNIVTKEIELWFSDTPTSCSVSIENHNFHLSFSCDKNGNVVKGWIFNIMFDGKAYDLYDAPHGPGRNEISKGLWNEGDEEDFSWNQWSGNKYPFICKVKLMKILEQSSKTFLKARVSITLSIR